MSRPSPALVRPPSATRRTLRTSTLDGLFAVQYTTLTAGTLLTAFLLTLGATSIHIGIVAALPLLAGLLQPVGAEIIRRRGGRRKAVLIAAALADLVLWGAVVAAAAWTDAGVVVPVVVGVLAVQHAVRAFDAVAWTSWISDLVPPRLRGRYFGRRNFVCNAFGAVTAVVVGRVVGAAGEGSVGVYLVLIGVGAALRLVSIGFLTRQPEPRPAQSVPGGVWRQLGVPLAHAGFRPFLAFIAAWGFTVNLAAPFFAVYMLQEVRVGVEAVMLFAAIGTAANLVGQRVWGPLCDRHGDRQVMRLAAFVVALQPLWWLFTSGTGPGYYLMPLLSVTGGFFWGGYALASGNLMMTLAPELGKTSFFAVQAAFGGIAGALGPLVGSVLAEILQGEVGAPVEGVLGGLKALFLVSGVVRLGAWGLMHRLPETERRPRLRAALILRDTVRTLNPAQGFSPLLHVFALATRRGRDE